MLSQLSGKEFYWSVLSGGKKLIEHQEEINRINVFPVPDGDTGSNMAATATSIIYNSIENSSVELVASSIGDAALDGARGNSGVIFAQFLYSLGQEMAGLATISTHKFAEIVKKASKYVYEAIPHPQEGTIITVIRKWAESLDEEKDRHSCFETLLEQAEKVAKTALEETSRQLEAMRLANVVDAGAKGFVLFIEGMKETILKKAFSRDDHDLEDLLMTDTDLPVAEAEELTEESLHNRYCTETCIIGDNVDKAEVLKILEEDSDSIVTAGSEKKLRLHFHTNNPAEMFSKLRKFGKFTFQKIEDMRRQYTTTHHRKNDIAIIVDSGVGLDTEYLDEHQTHLVPASLDIEGTTYYDFRSMNIHLLDSYIKENSNIRIKTSQPSPKAFADMYAYLSKFYKSIVVITMSKGVSGTHNSAKQAIELIRKKTDIKIDILDTAHLSAGAGAVARCIIEDVHAGLSHEEVVEKAKSYGEKTDNFINFRTIDHMIRSGRLGAFQGRIIKFLNLCPVLEMHDGKPIVTGKAFGWKKALDKSIEAMTKKVKERKVKHYVVSHTMPDPKLLAPYIERLKNVFGVEPASVSEASPAIATNVGLEAICVGVVYQ